MRAVKLVTVGDVQAGKSCLTHRFKNGTFLTEGERICHNWNPNYSWNGFIVGFGFEEAPAQEGIEKLRVLHYPQTDIFLVVFSVDDPASLENVRSHWIPEITHHCPGTPFILVGCKTDLRDDPATIERLAKKNQALICTQQGIDMAREVAAYTYVECSSLKGEDNNNQVFHQAINAACGEAPGPYGGGSTKQSKENCILQ